MRFSAFLASPGVLPEKSFTGPDPEIVSVCNRASDVVPGSLFCAIRGAKADGHTFIPEALSRGASAVIAGLDYSGDALPDFFPCALVRDSYRAWAGVCAASAGQPASNFRLHGITGTNGKTTTAFLLRHFLACAGGRKCGLITTVVTDFCGGETEKSSGTMPPAPELQNMFSRLAAHHAQDAVMECSSHGLSQWRSGPALYSSGVFTNLTGDHLDYHKTQESYYQAKKRLFSALLAPGAPAVVNVDDPYGERLYSELENSSVQRVSLSMKNADADCFLREMRLALADTEIELVFRGKPVRFHTRLTGAHNVCNTLCAFVCAASLGISPESLADAAESLPPAPGRLEPFQLKNGARVFVDYAHTDDALQRVTEALNAVRDPAGRLISVFGCGGDRDRAKRPRMGKVAAENSDLVILTSDNPRSEDPLAILKEILQGVPAPFRACCRTIPDRAEAIRTALAEAREHDAVLIAGKGHETEQEIGGVKHPFDDRAEVRKAL